MRRPESVLLAAIWAFLAAFVALLAVVAVLFVAFPEVRQSVRMSPRAGYFLLSVLTLILLCYTGVGIAAGIGLLHAKEWARILAIVQASLSVFSVPFGTAIGVLVIIYLTKPAVKAYFEAKETAPSAPGEKEAGCAKGRALRTRKKSTPSLLREGVDRLNAY